MLCCKNSLLRYAAGFAQTEKVLLMPLIHHWIHTKLVWQSYTIVEKMRPQWSATKCISRTVAVDLEMRTILVAKWFKRRPTRWRLYILEEPGQNMAGFRKRTCKMANAFERRFRWEVSPRKTTICSVLFFMVGMSFCFSVATLMWEWYMMQTKCKYG